MNCIFMDSTTFGFLAVVALAFGSLGFLSPGGTDFLPGLFVDFVFYSSLTPVAGFAMGLF
jgi:hypothetical protein